MTVINLIKMIILISDNYSGSYIPRAGLHLSG